jgi:hypothetical protein
VYRLRPRHTGSSVAPTAVELHLTVFHGITRAGRTRRLQHAPCSRRHPELPTTCPRAPRSGMLPRSRQRGRTLAARATCPKPQQVLALAPAARAYQPRPAARIGAPRAYAFQKIVLCYSISSKISNFDLVFQAAVETSKIRPQPSPGFNLVFHAAVETSKILPQSSPDFRCLPSILNLALAPVVVGGMCQRSAGQSSPGLTVQPPPADACACLHEAVTHGVSGQAPPQLPSCLTVSRRRCPRRP